MGRRRNTLQGNIPVGSSNPGGCRVTVRLGPSSFFQTIAMGIGHGSVRRSICMWPKEVTGFLSTPCLVSSAPCVYCPSIRKYQHIQGICSKTAIRTRRKLAAS